MSSSDFRAARNQPNQTRSLKLIILVLVISNVLMGVVGVALLRSLDARYTTLINRTVPALNDLRVLEGEAFATFRAVGSTALFNAVAEKQPEALAAARLALKKSRTVLHETTSSAPFVDQGKLVTALSQSAKRFDAAVDELVTLFAGQQIEAAAQVRETKLRPAFDAYLVTIAKTADEVESIGLKDSDATTETMEGFSKLMLGLASWPILVVGALLLITGLFVLVLMLAFRGREMSDAP